MFGPNLTLKGSTKGGTPMFRKAFLFGGIRLLAGATVLVTPGPVQAQRGGGRGGGVPGGGPTLAPPPQEQAVARGTPQSHHPTGGALQGGASSSAPPAGRTGTPRA